MLNKYEIIKELTNGSFGKIYKAKFNNSYYVIKEDTNIALLEREANIYKDLRNVQFVSKLYDFFYNNLAGFMVIDYYDENLYNFKYRIFNTNNYEIIIIDIFTVLLNTLKEIHDLGYVHRDLKPLNICLKNNIPYLIDFGLSKKIIENKKHISEKKIKSIIGSYSFISNNVNNTIEPSRRDDIESFMYILLFMFVKKENEHSFIGFKIDLNIIKFILLENKIINSDSFAKILFYIQKMKFSQQPNYSYILKELFTLS